MSTLEDELARYSRQIESYLTKSSDFGIILLDCDLNILDCNIGFMRFFSPHHKPVGAPLNNYLKLDEYDLRNREQISIPCNPKTGKEGIFNCHRIQTDNGYIVLFERLLLTESRALEIVGVMNDDLIAMQRESVKKNLLLEKLKRELDDHIVKLESALAQVKQLEGIIPMCSYCKKIRNDSEIWQQLEIYLSEHSEALFSHGICPSCLDEQMEIIKKGVVGLCPAQLF